MLVGWLVAAFLPARAFPVLVMNGEAGTGKSTASGIVRDLIDPRIAGLRALPRDERDLSVAASNSWVLAFDNVSRVEDWLSDAICRVATGGGLGTRQLHSDRDETLFEGSRPIALNGIPDLMGRQDLADRAIAVTLVSIADKDRRSDDEIRAEFERARPEILGAVLDAVSSVLRNRTTVSVEGLPRMAGFARDLAAAEQGLGWSPGTFARAYAANREAMIEHVIEADPIASAVLSLMDTAWSWEGTASELLARLGEIVGELVRTSRIWPRHASSVGSRLRRAAPALRRARPYAVKIEDIPTDGLEPAANHQDFSHRSLIRTRRLLPAENGGGRKRKIRSGLPAARSALMRSCETLNFGARHGI